MTAINAADASALTQSTIQADVAIAVAKKSQDQQKQQGEAALALLDSAAQVANLSIDPNKGQAIDTLA
jgi:hypothetical protein